MYVRVSTYKNSGFSILRMRYRRHIIMVSNNESEILDTWIQTGPLKEINITHALHLKINTDLWSPFVSPYFRHPLRSSVSFSCAGITGSVLPLKLHLSWSALHYKLSTFSCESNVAEEHYQPRAQVNQTDQFIITRTRFLVVRSEDYHVFVTWSC